MRGSGLLSPTGILVPLLDLLLFKCGRRLGVEIKWMNAPSPTGSMRIALANLQFAHLTLDTFLRRAFGSPVGNCVCPPCQCDVRHLTSTI